MEQLSDDVDELVEFWTLLDEDRALLEGRRGATALGFALLLKHYSRHARFPRSRAELPDGVVEFVARQVAVPAADPPVRARLLDLIATEAEVDDSDNDTDGTQGSETVLGLIKSTPGTVSLESMKTEISKLEVVRAVGLPGGIFADVAPKVLDAWRARAAVEAPSHMRRHAEPLTLTLLAALVHQREREITDTLVELLIATVHRIGARAERRVTDELVNAFKRVSGKENILFSMAEAALEIRTVPFGLSCSRP